MINGYISVVDPDKGMVVGGGGGGGQLSRPGDKVGARSQRNLFWPFEPHFGLKVTEGGPPGPLPWI